MKKYNYQKTAILFILIIAQSLVNSEKLVLIGGAEDDDNYEIYNAFIEQSTPQGSEPNIGIISCASEYAEENGLYLVDMFKQLYSVKQVSWIPLTLSDLQVAYNESIVAQAQAMTGIFFGGGDQLNLIKCLYQNSSNSSRGFQNENGVKDNNSNKQKDSIINGNREDALIDTPLLAAIRANFNSNATAISGTSAGCVIQQGTALITGGESYQALLYGAFNYIDDEHPDYLSYYAGGGFGFFKYGYLDSHFATRGRQGRLIRLISDLLQENSFNQIKTAENQIKFNPQLVGFGIDENTALSVVDGVGKVLGETGVYVIDLSKAKIIQKKMSGKDRNVDSYFGIKQQLYDADTQFNIEDVLVSYLTNGDTINLQTLEVTYAAWKSNINGKQPFNYPMPPTHDIFSAGEDKNKGKETKKKVKMFNKGKDDDDIQQLGRKNPREFTKVSTDLVDCVKVNVTAGYTYETGPSFKVTMNKTSAVGYIGIKKQQRQKKGSFFKYLKTTGEIQYISFNQMQVGVRYLTQREGQVTKGWFSAIVEWLASYFF